jgi:hypothetical protein
MRQETAVEWLADQIQEQLNVFLPGAVLDEMMLIKAKQMEREQIIESFDEAISISGEWSYTDGEKYYNETYGKDKSED